MLAAIQTISRDIFLGSLMEPINLEIAPSLGVCWYSVDILSTNSCVVSFMRSWSKAFESEE